MSSILKKWALNILTSILFQVANKLWADAMEIIRPVVRTLNNTSLPNVDKAKHALAKVKENAKAKGIELKDNFINFLITVAVQEIKSNKL